MPSSAVSEQAVLWHSCNVRACDGASTRPHGNDLACGDREAAPCSSHSTRYRVYDERHDDDGYTAAYVRNLIREKLHRAWLPSVAGHGAQGQVTGEWVGEPPPELPQIVEDSSMRRGWRVIRQWKPGRGTNRGFRGLATVVNPIVSRRINYYGRF